MPGMTPSTHPYESFQAPVSITAGTPLKSIINKVLVGKIGASFANVYPPFNRQRFARRANKTLEERELKDRGIHIAEALAAELPQRFGDAQPVFLRALGPCHTTDTEFGLKPFFYYPHSFFIAEHGPADIPLALDACHALTQRFTAEFCIRPLIQSDQKRVFRQLHTWAQDDSPHVRRLVSEGTRARLPWAGRLKSIQDDPTPVIPLLDQLKSDTSLYVRRSVANHLGDIAKDHLEVALDIASTWAEEAKKLSTMQQKELHWVLRHALRHPAKKGIQRALELRLQARP